METAVDLLEPVDFEAGDRRLDEHVLLRALLELAESAERNLQRSRTENEDAGPMLEAA